MEYISHPCIKPESLERRQYQFSISMDALEDHSLVVIPTGLGKTAIALIVAASRYYTIGGKILIVAPTKPLVEQHIRYFKNLFLVHDSKTPDDDFLFFTGETKAASRGAAWEKASVIFSTPQVIKNDIIAGRYSLAEVSLFVIDEAHRTVGNYAYVFLAEQYLKTACEPLILAMTASPGGNIEKISDIVQNLRVTKVLTRTEEDPDVKPYIHEKEIEYLSLSLPDALKKASHLLDILIKDRLHQLQEMGYAIPPKANLSMRTLNEISSHIQQSIARHDADGFVAASIHAELMKLRHAVLLCESQGSQVFSHYLQKLLLEANSPGGSKASRRIAEDPRFMQLLDMTIEWKEEIHPKFHILPEIIRSQLKQDPESKIIIFASYRDTVAGIVAALEREGISAERFVGQSGKENDTGLSQKKQIEVLNRFFMREFAVLVATSVGEEGLDIPSTDMVIFFEPVSSEIRSIQRKGRTGRHGTGSIIVLVTKGTSDEVAKSVSQKREKTMSQHIRGGIQSTQAQTSLFSPPPDPAEVRETLERLKSGPCIIVDDRETHSRVVEHLARMQSHLNLERLEVGDYLIGRLLIERKTTTDFVNSLIDRNLMTQLMRLSEQAYKPLLIIEGDGLYTVRDVHPNAIRGALAAIVVDMGIGILYTRTAEETAEMLCVLARREDDEPSHSYYSVPKRAYRSIKEAQETIIASFPNIGPTNAKKLLEEFGSVQGVVTASIDEITVIKGIGTKKAEKMFEVATRHYERG
ncbi:MAG: DEAD/DEAH box helicase [Methanomicrobiales archaeon]|jgi:Fanconi anemia group M protein|nr:DEAD/DEAH box helicase [Methanomicrobiales archaeon]